MRRLGVWHAGETTELDAHVDDLIDVSSEVRGQDTSDFEMALATIHSAERIIEFIEDAETCFQ